MMKEITTVLFLEFILTLYSRAEKVDGYYIDMAHDTIQVTFNINLAYGDIPDLEDLQLFLAER
jgi:hypothetical protein